MFFITIDNHTLTYTIKLEKRKTIQLKIIDSTHLEITAPKGIEPTAIETVLKNKEKWIKSKIDHIKKTADNPVNKTLFSGSQLLYLGKIYTLDFDRQNILQPATAICDNKLIVHLPKKNGSVTVLQDALRGWYVNQAKKILAEKTAAWSRLIGVFPNRITIKEQKTRWGSCSSLGNVNFNWRIIMAAPEIVDYLVVHELCHLLVPNHSQRFWQQVENYIPNYKELRRWLRTNGPLLNGPF